MSPSCSVARATRRSTTILIAPAVAVLALVSACGGAPSVTAEKDAPAQPIELGDARPTTTRTRTATTAKGISGALVPPFTINRTGWFEGFKVTLNTASVDTEKKMLKIDGEVHNEGPTDDSLYDDVRLEQDSVAIASGSLRSDQVLAGSRAAATIEIRSLPGTFDPAKAVLVIGDAKHQQVRVPLQGTDPGTTGEPLAVTPPPPEIVAGGLHLTFDKLSLRGDDPKGHKQATVDTQFVVAEVSIRFDGIAGYVANQNLTMIPPKGAPQSSQYAGRAPRNGATEKMFVVWEMPTPIGGVYTLQVKGEFAYSNKNLGPDRDVTVDAKITLPTYPAAGKPAGS